MCPWGEGTRRGTHDCEDGERERGDGRRMKIEVKMYSEARHGIIRARTTKRVGKFLSLKSMPECLDALYGP